MKGFVVGLAVVVVAGCGSSGNPTSPTPTFPAVAGNYSGTTTITFPELNQTLSCPTTTSVTQNGGSINVAPFVIGGQCGLSLPAGAATITTAGAIEGSTSGAFTQQCGTYTYTGSGGFFGRDLRISFLYVSNTCFNMNITINVSR